MLQGQKQEGYTLVGALSALTLSLAITSTGIAYFQHSSRRLDNSATQIAASIRLARSRALINGQPIGVYFQKAGESYSEYGIFEDVGTDGAWSSRNACSDSAESEPCDTTEGNGQLDRTEDADGTALEEPISDIKDILAEGIFFGMPQDDEAKDPDGNPLGDSPIPDTAAVAFDVRGRLVQGDPDDPDTAATTTGIPQYIYLSNALQTDHRAIRVDPWNGYVQIYRWHGSQRIWRHR